MCNNSNENYLNTSFFATFHCSKCYIKKNIKDYGTIFYYEEGNQYACLKLLTHGQKRRHG